MAGKKTSSKATKAKAVSFGRVDTVRVGGGAAAAAKPQAAKSAVKPAPAGQKQQARKHDNSKKAKAASTPSQYAAAAAAAAAKKKKPKQVTIIRSGGTTTLAGRRSNKATRKSKRPSASKLKPYVALQLRNLPPTFQEPQLRKFLLQFNVPIRCMYIQRTRRTRASRGLAYVAFDGARAASQSMLDTVLAECHAMNLGGKTVMAKWVTLTRRMPSRLAADKARAVDFTNKTKRVPMVQHDLKHFDWVARLRRAAENEKAGNKFLASVGIPYAFTGFGDQSKRLPAELVRASAVATRSRSVLRTAKATAAKFGWSDGKRITKAVAELKARRNKKKSKKEVMKA